MDITETTHPVFEANQVLTSAHLNDLFGYLDEQDRLTRANLIGVGIVCGLELALEEPGTIRLTRGVGITSAGYLILEPHDVGLVAAREYVMPDEVGYPPFLDTTKQPAAQYPLWELLDDEDEAGAVPLTDPKVGLDQKAVVLFLELRRDGQRNCAPNDCDDLGARVTATVRRLLVDVADLDRITGASADLLGTDPAELLALPDLRMPRFDVPSTGRVESAELLAAFQETFRGGRVAAATSAALTALYRAFGPLLVDRFPTNPFATFANTFGFLDAGPVTTEQARFVQYYWDLFDDLLAGYDEVRWTGLDLMCACCPPGAAFPRHLAIGVIDPVAHAAPRHRHAFVPSPAVGDCADRSRQLGELFGRLVAMVESFSEASAADRGIRATPSRCAPAPLSARAIPFYYEQRGAPPLYELWDPLKTARHRANQNLGYRAEEFQPTPPPFVTDPLRFDLAPNDFLRIEGHLGRDVREVLKELLSLRASHRLPIEVVALRTGAFDERGSDELGDVGLDGGECRFRDLEALYDTLRAELHCFLLKGVEYFYALPVPDGGVRHDDEPMVATLAVLRAGDPEFRTEPGTIGHRIEATLGWRRGRELPWVVPAAGVPDLPGQVSALVGAMSQLSERLADDLAQLDLTAVTDEYRRIVGIATRIEEFRQSGAFDAPGLADRLDDIAYGCRLDGVSELVAQWRLRAREAQQAQYLGNFLAQHPGVQHKAGVPLGGTFVLVYHQGPRRDRPTRPRNRERTHDGDAVYAEAVAEMRDGTVVADFFLPYIAGPGCATVTFQLPPARLVVSTTTACTDAEGFAEVTLETLGARGSLSVRVDDKPYVALPDPLPLAVGEHVLVVRDSEGAESAAIRIRIPEPLRIAETATEVDDAAGTWQALLTLAGGTPPYAADSGGIAEDRFTSEALPVDQVLTVTVTDSAGCTVTGSFQSGVTTCDLPCDGEALRAGYRFWLPEARPNLPINEYRADVRSFVVTDADGGTFDLTADVSGKVGSAPNSLSTARFGDTVARWLRAINELVAKAVGSDQWLSMAYAPPAHEGTTGTLYVDRLGCIGLTFELELAFQQGQRRRHLILRYDSAGTVITEPEAHAKARIPVYDVSTSNRCRPAEPAVPRCEGTDLVVEIARDGVIPDDIVLKAGTSGADQPAAFFWEIADGIPSMANGEAVTVTFDPIEPVEKRVRVTAFTERGCRVTREVPVDISRPG